MIHHVCVNFCGMYGQLKHERAVIQAFVYANEKIRNHLLSPEILKNISMSVAGYAKQECERLDMPISTQKAISLKQRIDSGQTYFPEVMDKELEGLMETIVMELSKQTFAYLPGPNSQYFEQEKLFGPIVHDNFPSAREDIKEAGNCLACGLDSAAVFHLMRVAEIWITSPRL